MGQLLLSYPTRDRSTNGWAGGFSQSAETGRRLRDAGRGGPRCFMWAKAKNLQQRLRNYRIANPDLGGCRDGICRLVREVARIEFQFCPGESAALKRGLNCSARSNPGFNRAYAAVWPWKDPVSRLAPGRVAIGTGVDGRAGGGLAAFRAAGLAVAGTSINRSPACYGWR